MSNPLRATHSSLTDQAVAGPVPLDREVEASQGAPTSDRAMAKAKCAVAEYLRDLGLRDPDVVAKESQRIVTEARQSLPFGDSSDESSLCESAVRLTVKHLEHWLEVLAAQSAGPHHSQRWGSVIAARLPGLLDRFPESLNGSEPPAELVHSLRTGLTPVVPSTRPRRMRRQKLPLVPSSLKRLGAAIRKLSLGRRKTTTEEPEATKTQ